MSDDYFKRGQRDSERNNRLDDSSCRNDGDRDSYNQGYEKGERWSRYAEERNSEDID